MTTSFLKKLALPAVLLLAQTAGAQSTPTDTRMPGSAAAQASPDNTENSRAGRPGSGPTADQQKNDATDLDITRQIRRSIMADKMLSTSAHNVTIVSEGGQVTLKGVVQSAAEKKSVAEKAMAVAGRTRVVDELQLAPK